MKTDSTRMLAILVLNDLLASNVIDQRIYDKALNKIENNETLFADHVERAATA